MSADLQPVLKGTLLNLRPLRREDFDALYAVGSDPEVWAQHPNKDRWQKPVFEQYFEKNLEEKGALIAEDAKTGRVIGLSCYYENDATLRTVAIGYTFLARDCWGHTYNKEMKQMMIAHAFTFADHVVFHIGENNLRSRVAIEKIGAQYVGRIERLFPDGTPNPSVLYQISKSA